MKIVEWLERTFFGGYTGSPEGRRDFARNELIRFGYPLTAVNRVLQEEDDRLAAEGRSW